MLIKVVPRGQVHGLPKHKFNGDKVCDACIKRKKVRSSFKSKK